MAQLAPSKPDLTAYENPIRLEPAEIVRELRTHLGARLVAFVAGVSETRAVHEWAAGERQIRQSDVLDRLRLPYQIMQLIGARDDDAVIQAWFQGLNPNMVDFLERKLDMPRAEAYNLAGMVGDARPGNAVCSPGAMRFSMPKGIFVNGISIP